MAKGSRGGKRGGGAGGSTMSNYQARQAAKALGYEDATESVGLLAEQKVGAEVDLMDIYTGETATYKLNTINVPVLGPGGEWHDVAQGRWERTSGNIDAIYGQFGHNISSLNTNMENLAAKVRKKGRGKKFSF